MIFVKVYQHSEHGVMHAAVMPREPFDSKVRKALMDIDPTLGNVDILPVTSQERRVHGLPQGGFVYKITPRTIALGTNPTPSQIADAIARISGGKVDMGDRVRVTRLIPLTRSTSPQPPQVQPTPPAPPAQAQPPKEESPRQPILFVPNKNIRITVNPAISQHQDIAKPLSQGVPLSDLLIEDVIGDDLRALDRFFTHENRPRGRTPLIDPRTGKAVVVQESARARPPLAGVIPNPTALENVKKLVEDLKASAEVIGDNVIILKAEELLPLEEVVQRTLLAGSTKNMNIQFEDEGQTLATTTEQVTNANKHEAADDPTGPNYWLISGGVLLIGAAAYYLGTRKRG